MIACIAPTWVAQQHHQQHVWKGEDNTEESLSTLAFASRAKCVRSVLLTRAPYSAAAAAGPAPASSSASAHHHRHQYEVNNAAQQQQQPPPPRSGSGSAPTRNATPGLRAASPAATNAGVKHQSLRPTAQVPALVGVPSAGSSTHSTSGGGSSTPRRWMR